jgi:2-C-methyl-D-erythritol 4-phosphate cytidylyltransferase
MSDTQKVWVVIPAAGIGKRMQSAIPKQYLKVNDKTILEHTLGCFSSHPEIAGIIVVLNTDDYYWKTIQQDTTLNSKPVYTVEGGKERSDSVMQGLDYLLMVERLNENSWIMVHDAARPCLLKQDIDALLSIRSKSSAGGILASPVRDTMKRAVSKTDIISRTESRENLWHALTPQLFRIGELKEALEHCFEKGKPVTDEASALEALGKSVVLVEGSSNNIKVTQTSDLELVTLLLSSPAFLKGNTSND